MGPEFSRNSFCVDNGLCLRFRIEMTSSQIISRNAFDRSLGWNQKRSSLQMRSGQRINALFRVIYQLSRDNSLDVEQRDNEIRDSLATRV